MRHSRDVIDKILDIADQHKASGIITISDVVNECQPVFLFSAKHNIRYKRMTAYRYLTHMARTGLLISYREKGITIFRKV